MTRREEIIAEAKKHEYDWSVDVDRFDVPDIFAKGAEWMQEIMIKKACEWITEHIFDFPWYDSESELSSKDIAEEIRKAMEE